MILPVIVAMKSDLLALEPVWGYHTVGDIKIIKRANCLLSVDAR
jgi:hypothetical protein